MTDETLLTADEKQLIVGTYPLVAPVWEMVADLFYGRLFEDEPRYRELFPGDMSRHKRKLMAMLAFVTKSLDWTEDQWRDEVAPQEDLFLVVLALGRRRRALDKIPGDVYGPVERALIWALEQGLGQAFTPQLRDAWSKLYRVLSTSMRMGEGAAAVGMDPGRAS